MRKRKSKQEPTPEDLERGRAFALWLNNIADKMSLSVSRLAQRTEISAGYLYDLARGGIKMVDGEAQFKRPSEEIIHRIAQVAGVDPGDGLRAAGFAATELPAPPAPLAQLPTDIQYRLAGIFKDLGDLYNPKSLAKLPIVGFAGAVGRNFDVFAEEHHLGELVFPTALLKKHDPQRCFIVRVRGNCMEGSRIADGDYAICVAADTANDRDIVLVIDEEREVLKRFREVVEGKRKVRWLETDESNGERNEYIPGGAPRIIGKLIALHREF